MDDEPKGDCPFCDAPKWHICKHFVGYVRDGKHVFNDHGRGSGPRSQTLRKVEKADVCVNTGVSVRAYRKPDHAP